MTQPKPPPSRALSLGFGITPKERDADPDPTVERSSLSTRKAKVLIVDQDPSIRRIMLAHLNGANYAASTTESGKAALDACIRSRPNLVISELRLEDMDGLALLKELKSRWPHVTVIILATHATIPEAVQATQGGAFSFLVKPVGKQELLGHVERGVAASSFSQTAGDWRERIVSRSRLMEDRLAAANRAAASTVPLLLVGASGTGKELFARAIHAAGPGRDKPFVAVSCRDAAEAVLDDEFFRRNNGGTLFLDEIHELPASLQLGVLHAVHEDVRLICTTSRDLQADVDAGKFLPELFERISGSPIEMPPLGRRREDIPLLLSHFLEQVEVPGTGEKLYTPETIERLATTDWPGNVKQLFDLVKQNVALTHGKVVTEPLVQQSMPQRGSEIPTYDEARDAFARAYLARNLQRTEGNVTQAARIAKRTRTDFYKLLARYRLQPDDFKPQSRGRRGR
jgi:two-component system response regulator GlrR